LISSSSGKNILARNSIATLGIVIHFFILSNKTSTLFGWNFRQRVYFTNRGLITKNPPLPPYHLLYPNPPVVHPPPLVLETLYCHLLAMLKFRSSQFPLIISGVQDNEQRTPRWITDAVTWFQNEENLKSLIPFDITMENVIAKPLSG
jgi:hypothetical protein